MSGCQMDVEGFDETGASLRREFLHLPDYLDWMPIAAKIYWFLRRGFGNPKAVRVLFNSQGERHLVKLDQPLEPINHRTYKERLNGLEYEVERYCQEQGISRTPRNQ